MCWARTLVSDSGDAAGKRSSAPSRARPQVRARGADLDSGGRSQARIIRPEATAPSCSSGRSKPRGGISDDTRGRCATGVPRHAPDAGRAGLQRSGYRRSTDLEDVRIEDRPFQIRERRRTPSALDSGRSVLATSTETTVLRERRSRATRLPLRARTRRPAGRLRRGRASRAAGASVATVTPVSVGLRLAETARTSRS